MSVADSGDKSSVGEGLFGCALMLALGVYLTWPIFERGRPASFLAVGLFVMSGLCYLIAEWIKEPSKSQQPDAAKRVEPPKNKLVRRIAAGLVSSIQKAALWTAVGLTLVWLFQLVLKFLPERIGPEGAASLQLFAYDVSHRLKTEITPLRFASVVLAGLALSTAVGSVWPINIAAKLKKWAGIAASVLIAFSTITFVTAQTGSDRFDASVGDIRGVIGADLERLRRTRQEKAALQWVGATIQHIRASPEEAASWREYLTSAAGRCEAAQAEFIAGYRSVPHVPYLLQESYCDAPDYLASLTTKRLRQPEAAPSDRGEIWPWMPEWGSLRDSAHSTMPRLTAPRRFSDLLTLSNRVKNAADAEERARDNIESAVTDLMSALLPETAVGVAPKIVGALKNAVLKAIYQDTREKVAMWLRLRNVSVPRTFRAVLGIEPQVRLVSPAADIRKAGGVEALTREVWSLEHGSLETVRERGRQAATNDVEYNAREQERIAAQDRRIREIRRTTARPRGR